MNKLRSGTLALLLALPLTAGADVSAGDLPGDTIWYLHADLDALRESEAGGRLYSFFEEEVVIEVNDELGIDLNDELESITAFSDSNLGTVVVVDGPLSQDTKDKLLALVSAEQEMDAREHSGTDYFFIGDDESDGDGSNEPFDDLEDSAYFSFGLKNRAVITGNEAQMKAMLDNGGRIAGSGNHDGALFVLSADTTFVQAGLRTDELSVDDDDEGKSGWESNILSNTEQAALLISEASGLIAVEAKLISTDPKMARAIGGIVNGLIGLQAFNSELGPEIQELIRGTKVEVEDNTLSISSVVDPDLIVAIVEE